MNIDLFCPTLTLTIVSCPHSANALYCCNEKYDLLLCLRRYHATLLVCFFIVDLCIQCRGLVSQCDNVPPCHRLSSFFCLGSVILVSLIPVLLSSSNTRLSGDERFLPTIVTVNCNPTDLYSGSLHIYMSLATRWCLTKFEIFINILFSITSTQHFHISGGVYYDVVSCCAVVTR